MAKKKRFTPRTQSAPAEVQDNSQSDPLDDFDPSFGFENDLDGEDGSFLPTVQKKPNKWWPVKVIGIQFTS